MTVLLLDYFGCAVLRVHNNQYLMLHWQSLRYVIRRVRTKRLMNAFVKVLSGPFQAKLTVPPAYIFPSALYHQNFKENYDIHLAKAHQ